jgi:hypothetical protein
LIDVLDRVLDKGIVVENAWVRVALGGIDLVNVDARVVVASIDTYLRYSEAVSASTAATHPSVGGHPSSESARPKSDDDDDDNGGGGSSGAPVMVFVEREPRRFPTPRPRRTRH